MNTDDSQRGNMGNPGNRPPKYPEKMPNYSPSTAFNYSPATGFNGGQQHPRRRNDRFKRESINLSDKVARQNDVIIRLLKEIRDRLPAPAFTEQKAAASATDPGVPASDPYTDEEEGGPKAENQEPETFQ
jgi:hypothetical protein